MQDNSNQRRYFKYGILIGVLLLMLFIYRFEYSNSIHKKNNKASADYLINDPSQQQQFLISNSTLNDTDIDTKCDCTNITNVKHGEKSPIFVPDTLPPLEPEIFDKLLANKYLDNTVLITVAGYGMRAEVYNWMKLLEYAEEYNFVVFCTDEKLYLNLLIAGYEDKAVLIPDDWFLGDLELFRNTELRLLDQNEYPRLSHVKTWVLQHLVFQDDLNIFYLDINQIVVHKRTIEYIHTLLSVRDDTKLITTQDSLDQHTINTGLMLLRPDSKQLKRLITSAAVLQEENTGLDQQTIFNMALNQLTFNVKTGMLVLLDIIHFPNGVHYFEDGLPQSKGVDPYIIHLNHKFGDERIDLLKANEYWPVNEDYVNYLSYQTDEFWTRRQEALQKIQEQEI